MKRIVLAMGLWLAATVGAACQCSFPTGIQANAVIGRLGVGSGPCQAIPFSVLSANLTGAQTTLNSGNGQTAPGAMAPGNTYSFGANTDTVRMTGLGLGGLAPATGLQIYNAAVSPGGNGQAVIGETAVNGGTFGGQGSTYDAALINKNLAVVVGVPTGTQNVVLQGTLTAASLSTAGTIAGSLCATSAGLVLYEAAVNCFAVSGITVVSGKTLTIDNTLELAGTDSTKFTFPSTTGTVATLEAAQTVSGNKTFSGTLNITGTGQINGTAFGTFATQNAATPGAIGGTTPNTGAFSTLSATTPIGLTSGGTNASTAAGARASGGLNVDELTSHGDSAYAVLSTDRVVGTSATLTAPRTWTLPAASSVNAGQTLIIQDFKGFVSGTNTITIVRNGSDNINGGTGSVVINNANGGFLLISDGVSNWSAQALGAQATAGVASINGQTGNPSIVAGAGINVATSGGNISVAATASVVPAQGRLTLASHTPVMVASQSSQTTLYYDSFVGNEVTYFNGTIDAIDTIASNEVSTAMQASSTGVLNANGVFDVWWEGNTNHKICVATNGSGGGWASDTAGSNTARGTGYSQLDFTTRSYPTNANTVTHCYNGATDYGSLSANRLTYLGTILTDAASAGQVSFTFGSSGSGGVAGRFGVWNTYNRVKVESMVQDSTASWTYAVSAVWRAANASATARVTLVTGLNQDGIEADYSALAAPGAATAAVSGIGLDSTTATSGTTGYIQGATVQSMAKFSGYSGAGLHFLSALEYNSSTTSSTWFGSGTSPVVSGLHVMARM